MLVFNTFMTIRTLSELLADAMAEIKTETTTIKELLDIFHERGFGFILFIIALPAALPIPALGINTIIALPLLILTAQQAMGRHIVWLPKSWKARSVSKAKVEGFIETANPWVKRMEFFVRPRLSFMTQGIFSNLIGVAGMVMSLCVAIPLPLTNTVPAFGIALMAIGVLMRDGLAVLGGMFVGILWVTILVVGVMFFGTEAFDVIKNFIKGFI